MNIERTQRWLRQFMRGEIEASEGDVRELADALRVLFYRWAGLTDQERASISDELLEVVVSVRAEAEWLVLERLDGTCQHLRASTIDDWRVVVGDSMGHVPRLPYIEGEGLWIDISPHDIDGITSQWFKAIQAADAFRRRH